VKKRIAFVVAVPITFHAFLQGHAEILADEYDITVVTNMDGHDLPDVARQFKFVHFSISRKIGLLGDLYALWQLCLILRRERFDIVHSVTPKAGLLAGLAGTLCLQKRRLHTFTGQVWATRAGIMRRILKSVDRLTLACTTHALADSPSQIEFLKAEGFYAEITVLGDGSIAGVDTERFRADAQARQEMRVQYGLSTEVVFGFLGRLNRDKGVPELIDAFIASGLGHDAVLLLVGPDEEALETEIQAKIEGTGLRVILNGATRTPERALAAMDVFCLPSHREGFGTSALEAAAMGLPAIVSRIYGLIDAVKEGETALCHEVGNVVQLSEAMRLMADDKALRARMGVAAQERALRYFTLARISNELAAFYRQVL